MQGTDSLTAPTFSLEERPVSDPGSAPAAHLQQLLQLGRQVGIAADLELAAEEQLHGRLHAAVDHRAKVVVGGLDGALGGAHRARNTAGRGGSEVRGPGPSVGTADLEEIYSRDIL